MRCSTQHTAHSTQHTAYSTPTLVRVQTGLADAAREHQLRTEGCGASPRTVGMAKPRQLFGLGSLEPLGQGQEERVSAHGLEPRRSLWHPCMACGRGCRLEYHAATTLTTRADPPPRPAAGTAARRPAEVNRTGRACHSPTSHTPRRASTTPTTHTHTHTHAHAQPSTQGHTLTCLAIKAAAEATSTSTHAGTAGREVCASPPIEGTSHTHARAPHTVS